MPGFPNYIFGDIHDKDSVLCDYFLGNRHVDEGTELKGGLRGYSIFLDLSYLKLVRNSLLYRRQWL